MQARGWVPFVSTFAAFFSRAYDFVRMAAVSRANLRLSGSHAGVSIGQDGPSQMALEDMAAMRAVHGSTVLHPSDANQTAALVAQMADLPGVSYLRTLRGPTVVRTAPDEDVPIGGSREVRSSHDDDVTLVACGVTVGEAEAAADTLAGEGVRARVLDCYSVKPIDVAALRRAAGDTHALITVEDHWPEGGLGEAVLSALADFADPLVVRKLAVGEMPISGSPAELLAVAGIDAESIANAARGLLAQRRSLVG
jgi:transketolase